MDQWDWKVSAPEFIPSGPPPAQAVAAASRPSFALASSGPGGSSGFPTSGLIGGGLGFGCGFGGGCGPLGGIIGGPLAGPPLLGGNDAGGPPASAGQACQGIGQLGFGVHGLGPLPMPGAVVVSPSPLQPTNRGGGEEHMVGHMRAKYEWQLHSKEQKLQDLQDRLSREAAERANMKADFERDRQGLMNQVNQLVAAVERYGISVEQPQPPRETREPKHAKGGDVRGQNRLESKMEQLNSLLQQEGKGGEKEKGGKGANAGAGAFQRGLGGAGPGGAAGKAAGRWQEADWRSKGSAPASASSSGHKGGSGQRDDRFLGGDPAAEVWEEAEKALHALERQTGSSIDGQARAALDSLGPEGAREAVRRCEEAVQAQGGRCSNLSSVLQGVCRKVRRRGHEDAPAGQPTRDQKSGAGSVGGKSAPGPGANAWFPPGAERRKELWSSPAGGGKGPRQGGPPEDDFEASRSRPSGPEERNWRSSGRGEAPPAGSAGKEDPLAEQRLAQAKIGNLWSISRFEKLSHQGAWELRRVDEHTWDLRIGMSALSPPLNDEGMQVYCRWLRQGLQRTKEECNLRSLRQLRAEVNFSKNCLSDDAVGRLLQALQRAELHVASLNLYGNCLSAVGIGHVAEYLRSAALPTHQIHLSHNRIDDVAAMDLVRAIAEHPRYPPRLGRDMPVPVWLRLNNNWIQEPRKVIRKLESVCTGNGYGGICLAHNRNVCGPGKCACPTRGGQPPLLHLFSFETQDRPMPEPELPLDPTGAPTASAATSGATGFGSEQTRLPSQGTVSQSRSSGNVITGASPSAPSSAPGPGRSYTSRGGDGRERGLWPDNEPGSGAGERRSARGGPSQGGDDRGDGGQRRHNAHPNSISSARANSAYQPLVGQSALRVERRDVTEASFVKDAAEGKTRLPGTSMVASALRRSAPSNAAAVPGERVPVVRFSDEDSGGEAAENRKARRKRAPSAGGASSGSEDVAPSGLVAAIRGSPPQPAQSSRINTVPPEQEHQCRMWTVSSAFAEEAPSTPPPSEATPGQRPDDAAPGGAVARRHPRSPEQTPEPIGSGSKVGLSSPGDADGAPPAKAEKAKATGPAEDDDKQARKDERSSGGKKKEERRKPPKRPEADVEDDETVVERPGNKLMAPPRAILQRPRPPAPAAAPVAEPPVEPAAEETPSAGTASAEPVKEEAEEKKAASAPVVEANKGVPEEAAAERTAAEDAQEEVVAAVVEAVAAAQEDPIAD
eukprot:TRINITY_DN12898_c0_g1_i2.p1 TRINITY_DN12898_c0_g1~~TRINITY_DN12898_c0_g1_i2.p1  ORF type:complete len:1268 (+),score=317.17 TRINITY_DN12898_c0_g1_i2:102-3806(+)